MTRVRTFGGKLQLLRWAPLAAGIVAAFLVFSQKLPGVKTHSRREGTFHTAQKVLRIGMNRTLDNCECKISPLMIPVFFMSLSPHPTTVNIAGLQLVREVAHAAIASLALSEKLGFDVTPADVHVYLIPHETAQLLSQGKSSSKIAPLQNFELFNYNNLEKGSCLLLELLPTRKTSNISLQNSSNPNNYDANHAWGSYLQQFQRKMQKPFHSSVRFAAEDRLFPNLNSQEQMSKRVLFVTNELSHTPFATGGIGTFNVLLAKELSSAGFSVSILFTLSAWEHLSFIETENLCALFASWGVRLLSLPEISFSANNDHLRDSFRVLEFLLANEVEYDIIHFHEYGGLAFYPLIAKVQGWAIPNSAVIVGMHGSSAWVTNVNGAFPHGAGSLSILFCERRSVEMADIVWTPSAYMAGFVQSRKWSTRHPIWVAPLPLSKELILESGKNVSFELLSDPAGRYELVFFGRLEPRKGIHVFIEAILAAERIVGSFSVTFLGRSPTIPKYGNMRKWVENQLRSSSLQISFFDSLSSEEALQYLLQPLRLACMPALVDNSPLVVYEALALGVPFISSNTGGIPELVHEDDIGYALVPPNAKAWTSKIVAIMTGQETVRRVRPRFTLASSTAAHIMLHQTAINQRPLAHFAQFPLKPPFVSVIITTHDRPHLLTQTVDAVLSQTYPHNFFEIIVVDDGSILPETVSGLLDVENMLTSSSIGCVLRIEHQYLGAARNRGAEIAKGSILAFLDDDDIPVEKYIEQLVTVAEHTGADIISTHFAIFSGAIVPSTPQELYLFIGQAMSSTLLENGFGGANIFVRKAVFDKIGGFSELVNVGYEDYEFLVKAGLLRLKHEVVPAPLLWVRRTPGSMSRTADVVPGMMRVASAMQSAFSDDSAAFDLSDMIAHVVGEKFEKSEEKQRNVFVGKKVVNHLLLFSLVQGASNMHYGAIIVPLLRDVNANDASLFPPTLLQWSLLHPEAAFEAGVTCLSRFDCKLEANPVHDKHISWDAKFSAPAWRTPNISSTQWPWIDAETMHPSVFQERSTLVMRTWRSFLAGDVTVLVTYEFGNQGCGDGVCLSLLYNGAATWRDCSIDDSKRVIMRKGVKKMRLRLILGDTVSLILDPLGNDKCDGSTAFLSFEEDAV